jgi:hypothetical protein
VNDVGTTCKMLHPAQNGRAFDKTGQEPGDRQIKSINCRVRPVSRCSTIVLWFPAAASHVLRRSESAGNVWLDALLALNRWRRQFFGSDRGTLLRTLLVALLSSVLIGLTLIVPGQSLASITNTRVDPAGTVELAGSGWLDGSGVDVYSNGSSSTNAAGPHYTNGIYDGEMWQCVELINRLYLTRGWISTTWYGNGDQLYAKAPGYLNKQAQGSITYLRPGDVVSLAYGSFGHADVVNDVAGSSVQLVNQNATAVYSSADLSGGTLTLNGWAGYSVIGVIHRPSPPPPTGVGTKMVADVNGDGRGDAVVMFKDSGTAMVALGRSDGTFAQPVSWSYGQSVNCQYYLSDVNGDGKADLVAFTDSGGYWDVSLSSGTGFWSPVQWASNEGAGSAKRFLADVNGDGDADVVFFVASTGNWYVDLSSGSGFWGPPSLWISGHGVGSSNQVMGDFNGDGTADAAIYVASTGSWYVALSTGSAFGYPSQWSSGHGIASSTQLAGDISGDHRADTAYYYTNGTWEAGTSSGSGFWQPTYWAYGQGANSDQQFLADVNGDGKLDEVTYFNATGSWYVDVSSGTGFYGPSILGISGHGANS